MPFANTQILTSDRRLQKGGQTRTEERPREDAVGVYTEARTED